MATMETRSIESPDETRPFQADGHMDVVTLGGVHVGENLLTGWQWSKDVEPVAGTESFMTRLAGICVSGQMTVRSDDVNEATVVAGDVFVLDWSPDMTPGLSATNPA